MNFAWRYTNVGKGHFLSQNLMHRNISIQIWRANYPEACVSENASKLRMLAVTLGQSGKRKKTEANRFDEFAIFTSWICIGVIVNNNIE